MNGPTFAAPAAPPATRPAGPRPAARPPKPDPDAGAAGRVLTYLRLHWLTILFCGTLLGGAGSYAAWELLPAKWESTAILQVDQTPASLANPNSPVQSRTEFATYVKTAAGLIRSEFVLSVALRDGGIADLPTIKDEKDPIKYLLDKLQVATADGSEIIRVSLDGHHPADVKKIVDAVKEAYMKEVAAKDKLRRQELLKLIADAQQDLRKKIDGRVARPDLTANGTTDPQVNQASARGLPPAPLPPLAGGPAAPPIQPPGTDYLSLMKKHNQAKIVEDYQRLSAEAARLPAEIQSLKKRAEALRAEVKALDTAPITNPLVLAAVESDPGVLAQARLTKDAKFQYDFALDTNADKNGRDVQAKRQVWEAQRKALADARQMKAVQVEGAARIPAMQERTAKAAALDEKAEELAAQLRAAQASLPGLERVLAELPAKTEAVRVAADGRPEKLYTPEETDKLVLDAVYGRVGTNLYAAQVELGTLDRVRVIQPASSPIQKDTKKQVIGAVAAGLLGYVLLALGLIGYETLARRVSSLADLSAAGPAPVVGVIPHRPGAAGQAAAAEALDKLRAYVGQTWLARGAGCVAVTSPVGDEGKGVAALGLADSLARAGYKTLLVDFDLRDPSLHTLAGAANTVGVCEALRGEIVDARDAVVPLPTGLDLLPAGAWSEAAGRAAVGRRLDELLTRLKEPYDCVVVNTHAVLAAAEAVEVVRRCEAVLVCARYRETTVPLLRRATDRVAAMEVPYAGVVYVGATDAEALC